MEDRYVRHFNFAFAAVPRVVTHDTTISDGAHRLYTEIVGRTYGDESPDADRRELAVALGVTPTTITNRSDELEAKYWIIREPRFDDKNQRLSNVYHAFNDQLQCRAFREANYEAMGIPKVPKAVQERKLRAGIGGSPAHKEAGSTQVDMDDPDQLELRGVVNSSSQLYTDSDSDNKDSFAAPAAQELVISETDVASDPVPETVSVPTADPVPEPVSEVTVKPRKSRKRSTSKKPRALATLHPTHKAIARLLLGIELEATIHVNLPRINKLRRTILDLEGYPATEQPNAEEETVLEGYLQRFIRWYDRKCEDCDPPQSAESVSTWYGQWHDGRIKQEPNARILRVAPQVGTPVVLERPAEVKPARTALEIALDEQVKRRAQATQLGSTP